MLRPMRRKLSIALFSLGFVALTALIVGRALRERDLLGQRLQERAAAVELGWRTHWEQFLLAKARDGSLAPAYQLEFDRTGKHLRSSFFPQYAVHRDWSAFRTARSQGDEAKMKVFLTEALSERDSWDRVLAINAWKTQFG